MAAYGEEAEDMLDEAPAFEAEAPEEAEDVEFEKVDVPEIVELDD